MGIETIALVALQVAAADAAIGEAEDQAKNVIKNADLKTAEEAKGTKAKAAAAKVSFLNSGLTLEGSPIKSLESIFDTGISDIEQIRSNAKTTAKNILSKARTDAILSLASAGVTAAGGAGLFDPLNKSINNAAGFQFGFGGKGGIPTGGFAGATGVPFKSPTFDNSLAGA